MTKEQAKCLRPENSNAYNSVEHETDAERAKNIFSYQNNKPVDYIFKVPV